MCIILDEVEGISEHPKIAVVVNSVADCVKQLKCFEFLSKGTRQPISRRQNLKGKLGQRK